MVFVAIFGFSQKAYAAANTPSLSISSNSIAVDVDASEFETLQSSSANVSVTTTNPAGYELRLTTGTSTDLVSGSNTIPTLGSSTNASNFPIGRWGYSLDNTTFKPVPNSSGSGDIIATTSVANSVANNYSLYIGVKLANTQPSGVYTNTLTLSATANPIIYSLYYDAAGGNNAPDFQSATSNADSFTFTVDSTVPTMTGYTFKGWCMGTITGNGEVAAPTCSGTTYHSGDPLTLQYTAPTATIYAMWQRNTATIKLGTTNNVDSVYYGTNASAINTELTTTGFTAVSNTDYYFRTEADTGYTFSSWSGWISGNNATYSDGKSFTENGGVYTINAATVPNTYTVTFKSYNGNTTYGTQTFTYDDVATALRAHDATTGWTTTPTAPNGKHFYGWASSANSTTIAYTDQQQVRNLTSTNNGNVIVYAIWASTPTTYQISFNLNGNTSFTYNNTTYNATTSLGLCSTSVVYNGTAIPTSCSATITLPTITAPSGFTVAGWSTSSTGTSSPTYTSGQANVTLTSGTAIYAQSYKASKTLTATTQKNVSSATGTATSSSCVIAKVYNGATQNTSCNVTLPSNPYTLTAWTFNGWVNAGSSTTTTTTSGSAAGGSMSISGNVNIVATWKKDVTLTVSVTFDKNGGSADRSSSGTKTVTLYNGSTTLSSTNVSVTSPTCTTRSYYTCLGYNTSSTATSSSWNASTAKNISVSGTVAIGEATFTDTPVYYHVWQGDTHTITFKSYDGNTTYGTQDFVYGTATNIRAYNASSGWTTAPSAPSGKSFYGWASSANSTTRTYTNSQSINNLTSNTTVYAIWQKAAVTYTATTQKNVSSATGTGTTAQCTIAAVYNGSTQSTSCNVVLPSNPYTLTAWTFNGWVNAGSSTTTTTTSGTAASGSMSISGNVNIVATWKKDVTLTASVTFYKNGGSADRSASGTKTVTLYNGSTTVSATNVSVTSPTCTSRGGYVCLGYNTSSTATSSSWNVSTAKNMSVSGTVAI
ncbi:InlB B-repeat-containing protein, partial [Candidatus Saccharibacteria bacterium]|nr:InlB B-repeat-containing protein [Candidatus Saccharibacteria bacterium]